MSDLDRKLAELRKRLDAVESKQDRLQLEIKLAELAAKVEKAEAVASNLPK